MPKDFVIEKGVLKKYQGKKANVRIPRNVKVIDLHAFDRCLSLESVVIPDSVKNIKYNAFYLCKNLRSITIPDSVTDIEWGAFDCCSALTSVKVPHIEEIPKDLFSGCSALSSVTLPKGLKEIGNNAFFRCENLRSIEIPDSVERIGNSAFQECSGLTSVTLPDSVHDISGAFLRCRNLRSINIPLGVKTIGMGTFCECERLTSIDIPVGVEVIGYDAFKECKMLTSVNIPDSVTDIKRDAFRGCQSLELLRIPDSVTTIGDNAFEGCSKLTVICSENSCAHRYCEEKRVNYLLDYQFEAFGGVIPPGVEKLASPFSADEEQPNIFISYSHKDRDAVLKIIKKLYESGWKIWYDEGLTIGDRYDETLEEHVRNCAAFLLFVTENSLDSLYIKKNEIPWAIEFEKPIIKCILDEKIDYEIKNDVVAATVMPFDIEPALMKVSGLTKGERRKAKGITVIVNPDDRENVSVGGKDFAYCIYSEKNSAKARTILLDAKAYGANLYNAAESGEDEDRLRESACLIAVLDKAFLADEHLTRLLIDAFNAKRDIAVCLIEEVNDDDLPSELLDLHKMQWLNFAFGVTGDMNKKLALHLSKRGCVDTAALPGFAYRMTDKGIVITRYKGRDHNVVIENVYGGIPVVEIAENAFINCIHLQTLTLPNGLTRIGNNAFDGCSALCSVNIPGGVTCIEEETFSGCASLTSVSVPFGVKDIGERAFQFCTALKTVSIPRTVTEIHKETFRGCESLNTVSLPDSVEKIDFWGFSECTGLISITLPDSLSEIGEGAFSGCRNLRSVNIPDGVTVINKLAFEACSSLQSITIPDRVRLIGFGAFRATGLTTLTIPGSVKKIDSYAFEECGDLTSVVIEKGVRDLRFNVFRCCAELTSVTFPDKLPDTAIECINTIFTDCEKVTVRCWPDTWLWDFFKEKGIPVKSARPKLITFMRDARR